MQSEPSTHLSTSTDNPSPAGSSANGYLWYQYLQAMDVPLWVEKDKLSQWKALLTGQAASVVIHADSKDKSTKATVSSSTGLARASVGGPSSESPVSPSPMTAESMQEQRKVAEESGQYSDEKTVSASQATLKAPAQKTAHNTTQTDGNVDLKPLFVKPVNWQAAPSHSVYGTALSGEKIHLKIICRHSPDQPAASFAGKNGPSRFMYDYLQALQMSLQPDFELVISMAHLSEAGLSENCQRLTDHLFVGGDSVRSGQGEPAGRELLWLMGDEAVQSLLVREETVAARRQQVMSTRYGPQSVLCSYHPFELIQNPSLKKLAQEDFNYLAGCLRAGLCHP